MKRGLKVRSRYPRTDHVLVEENSPMKRGLKAMTRRARRRRRSYVEENSPMKRGLKAEIERLSAGDGVVVEEYSPMKRGLKVPPSIFGQGRLLSALTLRTQVSVP